MSTIHEKLLAVQTALKAPKGQKNSFGDYNYRSCEDILEAVKLLLAQNGLILTLSDAIELVGSRFYVKATATLADLSECVDHDTCISVTAFAREEETKKGMDGSQITGAASSYARKYALNGLFCIDDTADSDATNDGKEGQTKPVAKKPEKAPPPQTTQQTAPPKQPGASVVQQERILALAKELGMDVQKDICLPMKAMWPMPAPLAEATIKRLEQKKAALAKELDQKASKVAGEVFNAARAQGNEGEA